nr:AraC family transcriptional regulator [uncultured Blautia sp.]
MKAEYENVLDDHLGKIHFTYVNTWNQLLPAHWHEHLEIIYVLGGEITASINDVSYELKKRDIFLVNSNDIHYTYTHEDAKYYLLQIPPVHLERISTRWKGLKFQELIRSERMDTCGSENSLKSAQKQGHARANEGKNQKPADQIDDLNYQLGEIFREIADFYKEKKEGYHLLVLSAVYRLLYLLYTEGIRAEETTENAHGTLRDLERMKLCMEFVREHYGESISLADAAGLLSITPEHFCRLFRKYTGQTFLAYVNQIRMEHFHTDLMETDENITFLLDKNGITNYKGFLRKFKETYGEPPKEVRRRGKN